MVAWRTTSSSPRPVPRSQRAAGSRPGTGTRRRSPPPRRARPASGWRRRCGGSGRARRGSTRAPRAYALFRRERGPGRGGADCAVWLAITYKANFANPAAANGWFGRAERLLEDVAPGPLHGWVQVARATGWPTSTPPPTLTGGAAELARAAGDADLELTALAQLGLIQVGRGGTGGVRPHRRGHGRGAGRGAVEPRHGGLRVLRHAERLRAGQRRRAGGAVVPGGRRASSTATAARSSTPSAASSTAACCRPRAAGTTPRRRSRAGLRITDGTCPGLHDRALIRLAGLRVRQGRLEEAGRLLDRVGAGGEAEAEAALSVAALLLARGDAAGARRLLEQRRPAWTATATHLDAALDLLVDAHLSLGDIPGPPRPRPGWPRSPVRPAAGSGRGRSPPVAAGRIAVGQRASPRWRSRLLEAALAGWSRLDLPFEAARTRSSWPSGSLAASARARRRPRPAGAGRLRGPRRRARGRPGGGLLRSLGVTGRPQRRKAWAAHTPGAGGAGAARRRPVQPRDRRAPAREPQDRVPPRQQHPHQARAAQPGRGGGVRGGAARGTAPDGRRRRTGRPMHGPERSDQRMGHLPDEPGAAAPHHRS